MVVDGVHGNHLLARPDGSLYVTTNPENEDGLGQVWQVQDGRKTLVDSGLKFATGLAYRPDQWLLSVADGHSKWVYSYQIQPDGKLSNKECFFSLHVADWDDDAGGRISLLCEGRAIVSRHPHGNPSLRGRRSNPGDSAVAGSLSCGGGLLGWRGHEHAVCHWRR